MREFDVSKGWTILSAASASADRPIERSAARELARWLGELRGRTTGNTAAVPLPIVPADSPAPPESTPIIVLNSGDASNGFSWRAGEERIEIYGDSPKGLLNGVFDFLIALGFDWKAPGAARFPPIAEDGGSAGRTLFPLARSGSYQKPQSDGGPIVLEGGRGEAPAEAVLRAARNKADAVLLRTRITEDVRSRSADYGIAIHADGPPLGTLVPKLLFPFRPDLFRMESGRRRTDGFFCPTNPRALRLAAERAARFFRRFPHADVYRIGGAEVSFERAPCACPTCRAFTPAEQTLMAANAVAAGLTEAVPGARLLLEIGPMDEPGSVIAPRANLILSRRRAA